MVNIIHSRNLPKEHVLKAGTDYMAAYFRILVTKADGRQYVAADWQPNLITNAGLDGMGWGNKGGYIGQETRWIYWCRLGTGNTEPQFTDTALAIQRAEAATISYTNSTATVVVDSLYYRAQKNKYRFSQGQADGIITEIGIGMKIGYGSLSTRALIRDTNGDPTQIIITPDEQVDVEYEIRSYIPNVQPTDLQYLINNVLYDVKSGPGEVLNTGNMNGGFHYGGGIRNIYGYQGSYLPNYGVTGGVTAPDPWIYLPASNYGNGTGVPQTYVGGTYYQDSTLTLTYNDWYWGPKGFTAASPRSTMTRWQMSFTQNLDPTMGIPHDNTNELIMSFRHTWDRYTPP